ncbi:MAG: hypothetical protein C4313_01395 [Thermoflexus sp.]|uniref:hypothetical protein n=1 Tax=Thermoflexus sp. TaxID=1969742 RepID=UPI003325F581
MKEEHSPQGGIWFLLGLIGVVLLGWGWGLDRRPAAPWEVLQAWAAWQGGPLPMGGSPLGAVWNTLVFGIFGPDEGWMRSGALVAGALVALALWAMRPTLGTAGALGAIVLWILSPSAAAASRFLDGGSAAAAAWAAVLALWMTSLAWREWGLALALGIGAAAGPAFWTGAVGLLPLFGLARRGEPLPRWRTLARAGAVFVLAATGAGLRPSGLREAIDGLTAWMGGFRPEPALHGWLVLQALLRFEGGIFLLGLAGWIRAIRNRDRPGTTLGIGALLVLVLGGIRWGAPFTEHAVLLVPWVALAGHAVQGLWEALAPAFRARPGVAAAAAGMSGVGAILVVAAATWDVRPEGARWLFLAGVLGLLGMVIWLMGSLSSTGFSEGGIRSPALAGGLVGILLVLAGAQGAAMTAVVRRVDPMPGLSWSEMTAPEVAGLRAFLREQAAIRKEIPGALRIGVVTEGPEAIFWRWTLRDFSVRVVAAPPAALEEEKEFWIAPAGVALPMEPDRWVGRPFSVRIDPIDPMRLPRPEAVLWARLPVP